jgi:hypothetical protein
MFSLRGRLFIFLVLIGLSTMASEGFGGGSEPPADVRGPVSGGQPAPVRSPAVGVQEVPRPDGGRDVITYSLTPPGERQARQQAEIQKNDQAQEILKNVIIFK